MRQTLAALALACGAAAVTAVPANAAPRDDSNAIEAAVSADSRTADKAERDKYRHPAETLGFFGVAPSDTVVEIWPGGGWYTQVLAPYLKAHGTYYTAAPMPDGLKAVKRLKAADPGTYAAILPASFPAQPDTAHVPDGTADVVLTFRNIHNWEAAGATQTAFDQMYAMLKPGGTLGVVEHRLPEDMDSVTEARSGYMKRSTVLGYAKNAGFTLADSSDINANPADTHDHPKGVWTLPPTYQLGDTDHDKYAAIGESDRMTLKFTKPE